MMTASLSNSPDNIYGYGILNTWAAINYQFTTGLKNEEIIPNALKVFDAYPNPFNPSTSFDLQVGVAGHVSLNVYNLMGQVVGNLVNNTMDAGNYNITWDAANFSSGMYIVKAETANGIATQKVMLVK